MQQLDRDVNKAHALIIDGNPTSRSVLFQHLRDFGFGTIKTAGRLIDARDQLERRRFDVVICDYHFENSNESGQDLLEELRREHMLPYSTVFVMVTGEATYQKVAEAAEAALDSYLIKPFSANTLFERLKEARQRKRVLKDIFDSMDAKQYELAAQLCLNRFEQRQLYWLYAARIGAEILMMLKRNDEAKVLFDAVIEAKAVPWARLGVARVQLAQGEVAAARRTLESLLGDLPGDPQPDQWANLTQPTYVVTVKDRLTVTGPTKTILDSIVKTVVDLAGSFFGEIKGVIEQAPGAEGVFISELAGVDFEEPIAILVDGPDTPMLEFAIDDYHPRGHTMLLGGRSPTWVNNLINITLSWLLDSLMIFIGITGVPSNLLDGFLNDAFLAFQAIQLYDRRDEVGPYGRPENFLPTAAAPYNVEAIFSFVNHIWDTRGWRSATAKFRNGAPYSLGKHFVPGGLMSIAHQGELYTDYVEHLFIRDNRHERAEIVVQIGDGKAIEAGLARTQRLITGVMEAANVLTLAPRTAA